MVFRDFFRSGFFLLSRFDFFIQTIFLKFVIKKKQTDMTINKEKYSLPPPEKLNEWKLYI